jgi:hypothetical protein
VVDYRCRFLCYTDKKEGALKLNHDCVREFLLAMEENLTNENVYRLQSGYKVGCTSCSVQEEIYLIERLYEAGFIDVSISKFIGGSSDIRVRAITWHGHQFLDNIRPETAWEKTKSIAKSIGGASIMILSDIAAKVTAELIKNQLEL